MRVIVSQCVSSGGLVRPVLRQKCVYRLVGVKTGCCRNHEAGRCRKWVMSLYWMCELGNCYGVECGQQPSMPTAAAAPVQGMTI